MQYKVGMAWRGLIALAIAAGMATAAGLAGHSFAILERMEEGFERSLYTWGVIALSATATVTILIGGSRLFVRVKTNEPAEEQTGAGETDEKTQGPQRGLAHYGYLFILIAVFNMLLETLNRVTDGVMAILMLDGQPLTLMFALGVTPIMMILAVAERPEGAWIKWRTVFFTAALWPPAFLADQLRLSAIASEGPVPLAVSYSPVIVMVGWIALGGALGALDVMFSLGSPRAYEKKLKNIAFLTEGWSLWHGVPFLLLMFSMRWQHGWNGIPEIAGNPLYFAGVMAAATIALSRPRSRSDWGLASIAGLATAALTLGGTVLAGHAIEASNQAVPVFRLAVYIAASLPALAAAATTIRLSTRRNSRHQTAAGL